MNAPANFNNQTVDVVDMTAAFLVAWIAPSAEIRMPDLYNTFTLSSQLESSQSAEQRANCAENQCYDKVSLR